MTDIQFSTLMATFYAVAAVVTFGLGYLAGDTS